MQIHILNHNSKFSIYVCVDQSRGRKAHICVSPVPRAFYILFTYKRGIKRGKRGNSAEGIRGGGVLSEENLLMGMFGREFSSRSISTPNY
jgi:hypothetical protein